MIGDDHDFANNADDEKMAGKYRILLLAAQKAFEEYQFQLMMDVNENTQDFFYSKRIGNTGIYFLDVRVHRTFYFEQKYPLFGRKQLEDFEVDFFFFELFSFSFFFDKKLFKNL